jgi:8-oxo-dGTP diphosphatase
MEHQNHDASSPPLHEIRTATFDMQIWLVDRWTGTPVNAAPDEHDAVAWFETSDLDSLLLANESYLSMLTAVLVTRRRSGDQVCPHSAA